MPLSPFGAGHTAPPWGRANAAGDNALRPVLLALLVDTGLACLLFAWGAVTGVFNAFGWVAEVVILVFAVSFVYYRLGKS